MVFYDRPADRQPHAHALGLCRKERVKDTIQVLRIDPYSGVFHGDQHTVEFVSFSSLFVEPAHDLSLHSLRQPRSQSSSPLPAATELD